MDESDAKRKSGFGKKIFLRRLRLMSSILEREVTKRVQIPFPQKSLLIWVVFLRFSGK